MVRNKAIRFVIHVNGKRHRANATLDTPLFNVLSNEPKLQVPRFGSGIEQCRVCTAHLGGQAALVCHTDRPPVGDKAVTTLRVLVKEAARNEYSIPCSRLSVLIDNQD